MREIWIPEATQQIGQPAPTIGGTVVPDTCQGISFTDACNAHDMCYVTFGNLKPACDAALGDDMRHECTSFFNKWSRGLDHDSQGYENLKNIRDDCLAIGDAYEMGVSAVPDFMFYDPAQEVGRCVEAHEDRDQYCL